MIDFQGAKDFILNELGNKLPENLTYHGLWHTKDVYRAACEFSNFYKLNEHDKIVLETAALYHDCGFLRVYRNHEEEGCVIASEVLPGFGYDNQIISEIQELIMATKIPQSPGRFLAELICDADLDYLGGSNYDKIAHLLFEEFKEYHIVNTELQWFEMQVGFLSAHQFFSDYSQENRNPNKLLNLKRVKEKLIEIKGHYE